MLERDGTDVKVLFVGVLFLSIVMNDVVQVIYKF